MAIPIDLITKLSLGLAFALCARTRLRADGLFASPAGLILLMFIGMIMMPITCYLYIAHPSWAWMYLVDPNTIPGFAILPLLVAHAAMIAVGWYLGCRLIQANRHSVLRVLVGSGAVLSVLLVILLWSRLGSYGTYREFHDGRALPIMDVKLGYVLVALLLAVLTSAGYVAVELVRDSRRTVSR
ncbi:MAG: hypothetical protein GY811_11265 [Myxococcales bacterium]|nr:hypothetical protein [Myxococcales bacterium]